MEIEKERIKMRAGDREGEGILVEFELKQNDFVLKKIFGWLS